MIKLYISLFFLMLLSAPAFGSDRQILEMSCEGELVQGGFVICSLPKTTFGNYQIKYGNDKTTGISAAHPALIPFSRNSALHVELTVIGNSSDQQQIKPVSLQLGKGTWAIERIDGLPPGKVTPRTLEQQRKVEADWIKKQAAWKHRANASWYANGFSKPVAKSRISGVYGSQRILNGQPKNPHLGYDFAAPKGTIIHAPANAMVVLADPDMYFEGGLLILDHGDGVMSVMLHLSRLDVKAGDKVNQGEAIGAVGATGRATGPHLHWGIKVRGTYINPKLLLDYQVK
ncbi:MAG: M23 family metallopeptidase [Robiginitomaculum sp.]|nr:M23 family metallopeptidase [Robiginitomaculum sp.]